MKQFLLLLFALISLTISSQIKLVKDVRVGADNSSPVNMFEFKGNIYYSANDGTNGSELWKTDGTEAGTVMVKDINPSGNSAPSFFFVLKDELYFSANPGGGSSLYKTDGTTDGTVEVPVGAMLFNPALINDTLYFVQTTDNNRFKYFDGTQIENVPNTGKGVERVLGGNFAALKEDVLLYMSKDYEADALGLQLYKYDTKVDSFVLVKDLTEDGSNAGISNMTTMGDKVFFEAFRGELWVSDGTTKGTHSIESASSISGVTSIYEWNNALYFEGDNGNDDQLWKFEAGSKPAVSMVKEIREGSANSSPANMIEFKGNIFFSANDGTNGSELWKTDGTTEGTVMVKDINPSGNSAPSFFFVLKDELYFSANPGGGSSLYKTDGTTDGTVEVPVGAMLFNPALINDTLYFVQTTDNNRFKYFDGTQIENVPNTGKGVERVLGGNFAALNEDVLLYMSKDYEADALGLQLYKYDTKVDSFVLVKNLTEDGSNAGISNMVTLGYKVYFEAFSGELWVSDGTTKGTFKMEEENSLTGVTNIYPWNDALYFEGDDGVSDELWKMEPGSTPDVTLVKDIRDGSANSSPANMIEFKENIFFSANDGTNGSELWKTDGTAEGTVMIKDINPSGNSAPSFFFVLKDELYFSANPGGGSSLYKTDGTTDGTVEVPVGAMLFNPALINDTLYFVQTTDNNRFKYFDGTKIENVPNTGKGIERVLGGNFAALNEDVLLYMSKDYEADALGLQLYKYDTKVDSFVLVKDLTEDGSNAGISNMVTLGDKVYFEAFSGELWVSDGTTEGTMALDTTATLSGVNSLFSWNNALYFEGDSGASDQLWKYDVALDTLIMMSDIASKGGANTDHDPANFMVYGDYLYYSAEDENSNKAHLWRTNGTSLEQLNSEFIDVDDITIIGTKLIFEADDNTNGNELYAYNIDELVADKFTKISNISALGGSNENHDPSDFAANGDYLYYKAKNETETKYYLWRTDGVKTEQLNDAIIDVDDLAFMNNKVYFEGDNGSDGNELYVFDTDAIVDDKLTMLSDIKALAGSNANHDPSDFIEFNSMLYYKAKGAGNTKSYLWRTDGNMIEQVDTVIIDVDDLVALDGKLYFEGDDEVLGNELYVFDPNYNAIERISAKSAGIVVYPNPSNGVVRILGDIAEGAQYTIYDINGRSVEHGTMVNKTITYKLSSGIYFLEIKHATQFTINKITVK